MSRARIVEGPLYLAALPKPVAAHTCGEVLLFVGTTRDSFEGRPVRGLVYEVYAEMAEPVMDAICAEVEATWPGARAAMVHRTGTLGLGDASVAIAVAAPHRDAAYAASRHAIEALKARVPIWKKELYGDGAAWKGNDGRHIPGSEP
jgi:molybdopterin synthase catalytic subunit